MKHYLDYIDFSNGICSEEINNNFKRLQDQINIERLSVAGQGISSGLQLNIKDFDLNVSEGYVVGNTGEEVYIPSTTINIEKPILIAKEETLGIKGGNKLSKSNTVSCRGKAHDKLAEYGEVFSLVEKDTGIYFMYGDTEPKPYKEVTDDNIQIDENDELGDLDLELTQDALEINFSDIL